MSKIRVLLCALALLIGGVVSCGCEDCEYKEEKYHAYANKSGETVKIVAIEEYYTMAVNNYEKIIANGDTSHSDGEWVSALDCGFVSYGHCDKPAKMELHFLSEPEKCLIFEGPIKNDGIDMRSWNSYERGKVLEKHDWVDIEYVYTITSEHRAMAKESYCP